MATRASREKTSAPSTVTKHPVRIRSCPSSCSRRCGSDAETYLLSVVLLQGLPSPSPPQDGGGPLRPERREFFGTLRRDPATISPPTNRSVASVSTLVG